jgi:hypothetical protein
MGLKVRNRTNTTTVEFDQALSRVKNPSALKTQRIGLPISARLLSLGLRKLRPCQYQWQMVPML